MRPDIRNAADLAARIIPGVADETALAALPSTIASDKGICVVEDSITLWVYNTASIATAASGSVVVPDDIEASADYISDPTTAPGRWRLSSAAPASSGGGTLVKTALAATTGNLVATRVGDVLTANANGALAAQDGVTLTVGQKLFAKDQSTGADKGLYTVTSVGSGGTPYVLTRSTDADESADWKSGCIIHVQSGTANGDTFWFLSTNDDITLNTTSLSFTKMPSLAQLASTDPAAGAALVGYDGGTTVKAALDTILSTGVAVASLTVAFGDLVALGAVVTGTIDFAGALPAGAMVLGYGANVTAIFDNAGDSASLTFDLGIKSGDTDVWVDGGSLNAVAKVSIPSGTNASLVGAVTPSVIFNSDVNFDTLTKGGATFYIAYTEPF